MKIFVGNLPFASTAEDVKKLFDDFGTVLSVDIVEDSDGKSRGFGFVEMTTDAEGHAAITGLNGSEFMGRVINLSPAHVKPPRSGSRKGEGRRSRSYQRRMEQAQGPESKREAYGRHPGPWRRFSGAEQPRHGTKGRHPRYEERSGEQGRSRAWEGSDRKPWRKRAEDRVGQTAKKHGKKASPFRARWEKHSGRKRTRGGR